MLSRLVTALGLSCVVFAACTWKDCKDDAKAGGLAVVDCAPQLFSDVIEAVHNGADGWAQDVVDFAGDAVCLKKNFERHLALAHSCADADMATCTVAITPDEKQRIVAAIAIVRNKVFWPLTDGGK